MRIRLPSHDNYGKSAPVGVIWRNAMADHGQLEYATAEGNDYPAHERTYRNFLRLVKVNIVVVAIIVILMAIFLT
jgi:Bacterial aa3 type cytochrome c oxidase subunit IV